MSRNYVRLKWPRRESALGGGSGIAAGLARARDGGPNACLLPERAPYGSIVAALGNNILGSSATGVVCLGSRGVAFGKGLGVGLELPLSTYLPRLPRIPSTGLGKICYLASSSLNVTQRKRRDVVDRVHIEWSASRLWDCAVEHVSIAFTI